MVIESGVRKCLGMHTFILGVPYVDHRDNDGLNNQRVNLRAATQAENNRARCHKASGCYSQYRGVTFRKLTGRWVAKIKKNRRLFNLGYFTSEVEAALAYDKAARRLFGDFAAPNFSDNGLQNTV